jgi:O-antigen ligase
MIVTFLILIWRAPTRLQFIASISSKSILAIFFVVTLFLCLPLPVSILSYLSPIRFQTLNQAHNLLGNLSSWQTLSYSPQIAFSWWVFLVSLFLFFVTVRSLYANATFLKRTVCAIMIIALIEAVYGLIQALVPSLGVLWVDHIQAYLGDARGTFINRNHFAGFVGMVWPLALGFMMAQGGWGQGYTIKKILASERLDRQALLALGVVVLLLALLFSRSRAGIAGASIGFLTFITLTRMGGKGRLRLDWLLLTGIAFVLAVYSMIIGVDAIADRFLKLGAGDSRLDFWRDSLPIIRDHPFGIGLRNFEKVFPIYNVSMLADKRLEYVHNDYLQLLIEAGWIGFIAVVSGFLIFMLKSVYLIKRLNSQKDPMRFFLAVGAFSGLVSLAFHSFFDFNLQIPANCVYFVTLMAIVHSCAWPSATADYADDADKFRRLRRINTQIARNLATDPHGHTQTFTPRAKKSHRFTK